MKTNCDIVQDLLPLYCDGACSAESRRLVDEHLRECPACSETFRLMGAAVPSGAAHTQQQTTAQAAAAWKKSVRRAVRKAYLITLAVVVVAAAAVCLHHGLNSTAEGSILGMTAQAEKALYTQNSELVLARKRGDYLAVLLRTEDGGSSMDVLERDSLFHDRWRGGPCSAGAPAGGVYLVDAADTDAHLLVVYGLDLPEAARWYTFRYDGTVYTCPITSRRVLDMFFVAPSASNLYADHPTLLDENMQPLD